MIRVTFRCPGDDDRTVEVREGDSLMTAAVFAGVPEIEGLCGGSIACGTCHLHIDESWRERIGGPGVSERDLLEGLGNYSPASRLGCQIVARSDLDGLIVTVAT